MRKSVILIVSAALSALFLLGIFVNPFFLYLAVFSLCPLMHILSGRHRHEHEEEDEEKDEHKGCH